MRRDNVKTLLSVPVDDCNFKAALEDASDVELAEAYETLALQLKAGFKVRRRLTAVKREIGIRAGAV